MEPVLLTKPIVRIDTPEISIRYKWEKDFSKLNQNIQILSIDDYETLVKSKDSKYHLPDNSIIGSILIKHPFHEDEYIPIEDAETIIYKDKMFGLSSIARCLGLSFKSKVELVELRTRNLDANGDMSYSKYADLDVKFKKSEEERIKNLIFTEQTIVENPCSKITSKEEFEQAKKLSQQYGLNSDTEVVSLIEGRNPDALHIISNRKVSLELSRELNSMFDIAFSLNVLKNVFKFNANVNEQINNKKTFKVESVFCSDESKING